MCISSAQFCSNFKKSLEIKNIYLAIIWVSYVRKTAAEIKNPSILMQVTADFYCFAPSYSSIKNPCTNKLKLVGPIVILEAQFQPEGMNH